MPRGQPFTALCQQAARLAGGVVADLHTHTTASDGEYTSSQVVTVAARARLRAVAITDHDTTAGIEAAVVAARAMGSAAPQVVPGVELTAEWEGRELHLLGLWVHPDDPVLKAALADICERRCNRFREYISQLMRTGVSLPNGAVETVEAGARSLGRRHVAGLLLRAGVVRNRFEAFARFLNPLAGSVPSVHRTPFAEAVCLIHAAGGLSVLAHPPAELSESTLIELKSLGLDGLEAIYPAAGVGQSALVRELADRLKLLVTGGSDCHGPDPPGRGIGSRGLGRADWDALAGLVRSGR
jgi:predicted metal-dependent phosphoesterase TrpH